MQHSIIVMGVAGCGKSSLARCVAQALGHPFIEGDDFHSAGNRARMAEGIALTDTDRADWLAALGAQLQQHPDGLVMTCSALKKAYRDQLRRSAKSLKFVYLNLDKHEALRRVSKRAAHFFPAALVDSQFATLESPVGEAGVLALDATEPPGVLHQQVTHWLSLGE